MHQQVADEQDGDRGIVFDPLEVQVFFEAVQAGLRQRIAIKVIEEVHGPENRLDIVRKQVTRVGWTVLTMIYLSSFRTRAISAGSVFSEAPE